jgi:hypothetical protein
LQSVFPITIFIITLLLKLKNMETVTVQLLNQKALKLLKQLEELNLIKIMEDSNLKPTQKLSDLFAGKLSDEAAAALHQHVKQTRAEWERDI